MQSYIRCARTCCATLALTSSIAVVGAQAQLITHHPVITGVSPRNPTPNQVVTITGTDLNVPTWTVVLQYNDKYSGAFHEQTLTFANGAYTFRAPSSLRPDSIAIQFNNASSFEARNNPIPIDEIRHILPTIHVQHVPDLNAVIGTVQTGGGGEFRVIKPGALTIPGTDLLRVSTLPFTFSSGITRAVIDADIISTLRPITPANAPTVRFGATTLSVSSAKYIPRLRDEVVANIGNIAHNTTAYLAVTTPLGSDSVRLTIVQPPLNARVVDRGTNNLVFTVNTGQLIRGRQYEIRGQNLVVRTTVGPNLVDHTTPTVTYNNTPIASVQVPGSTLTDTSVFFTIPVSTGPPSSPAPLTISHAGGSMVIGTFSTISAPTPLNISGAVITPSDIIAGTNATLTVSFNPTPANFTTAGALSVDVPAALTSVVTQLAPIPITSNPMVVSIPTNATSTTVAGNLTVRHSASGGGATSVAISVRPPRPTAVSISLDTIPGSTGTSGTVSFDFAGPATVLLSSSDPSVLSVPASVTRAGQTAAFNITTQSVTTARSITITAALNGVTATRSIVVAPGKLNTFTLSPATVVAGENTIGSLTFTVPVAGAPLALTASDTAVRVIGLSNPVTGASRQITFNTTNTLAAPVAVTISATSDGVTKTAVVQVNPMQVSQFSVSQSSAVGGTSLPATVRLGRTAIRTHTLLVTSSDTTVATIANFALFSTGEDVKVLNVLLRPGQTTAKTATITVKLLAANNANGPVISTKTLTVTATP